MRYTVGAPIRSPPFVLAAAPSRRIFHVAFIGQADSDPFVIRLRSIDRATKCESPVVDFRSVIFPEGLHPLLKQAPAIRLR
jgi:hypothetical protein